MFSLYDYSIRSAFFEKWIFYRKKEVTSDNDYYDTKVNKELLKLSLIHI